MAHDPTAAEVAAAIATLQAFEAAREMHVGGAVPVEPVMPSESPAVAAEAPVVEPSAPSAPVIESTSAADVVASDTETSVAPAVDPYVARSVKSSPNGF